MSNSSLVSYTKLSPFYTTRQNKIDHIIIHCMAGNLSVETCGNLFQTAEASSHYGIGSDGRIGQYCKEEYRAWTTGGTYPGTNTPIRVNGISGADLDHRAVTIEVANDSDYPELHITDKAMQSTIKLCADICKRNGIKELKWKGDKQYVGQVDVQNMGAHRWFAAKSCPGDYIYDHMGYIASEVNKILNGDEDVDGVVYNAHVQSIGWQGYVSNGKTAGTVGQAKRLEALMVKIHGIDGNIWTEPHIQTYGWMPPVKNGEIAGTTGQAKRLEAVKIALEGKAAEMYDIYYRMHVQTYGWLDWAKNGEIAGTVGLGKRGEAIEIVLVKKGGPAPGPTARPAILKDAA